MSEDLKEKTRKATTRRDLVLGGVLATGVAALGGPAAAEPRSQSPARRWVKVADVLVVGSGAAAMSAAIAVVQAGASVILVERAPAVGGTTARSQGAFWIPNNRFMRAKMIADPRSSAIRYMARDSYPQLYSASLPKLGLGDNEYALLETYYDNAAPIVEALEEAGAIRSTGGLVPDYLDHALESTVLRGRAMVPQRPDGTIGHGAELVRQLKTWLTDKGVPFLLNHRATGVERSANGEVIGLSVISPRGSLLLLANKAVIFGSGGYAHSPELLQTFHAGLTYGACAVPTAEGDFLRIGMQAGAKLGNMSSAWRSQVVLEQALKTRSVALTLELPPGDSMIIVNKYGRRVVNEKRNYHDRGRVHFVWDANEGEYPNQLLFMIYDRRTAELFSGDMLLPSAGTSEDYVIAASSVAELAAAIQQRLQSLAGAIGTITLAPGFATTLATQIETFNANARAGVDTQFERGHYPYDVEWHRNIDSVERTDTQWPPNPGPNFTMYPFTKSGPYFAIILGAGMLDTNGGPVINSRAQVLDAEDRPIPRLYGAGNCIASPVGQGYWGAGSTLGPAMTFGTIAGRNAAAEPNRKVS